ncbi:MAG: S1C family serine protease [Sandaracinaceae bacterium]
MNARRRNVAILLVAGGLGLFVLGLSCAAGAWLLVGSPSFSRPEPTPVVVTPRGDLAESERATVELFGQAAPSVVYITTRQRRMDPFRRNLQEAPRGSGSGFVWDQQGHVVTNFHVIQGASSAQVSFVDQSAYPADLVGYVAEKDLAVLRVDAPAESLRPLPVGTSHDLQVGQHVLAIGNPFGLDQTLSTGVISGLEREITSVTQRPITGMIQTDAAINPGNSGGPLLDSAGRLIGVNTAIYSPSGAYAGIGFAVPVDTVRRIVPQLIEHGRVVRPGLGVQIAPPQMVARLGLEGALVLSVQEGSPAERAGLQPTLRDADTGRVILGDLIVAVDDEEVGDNNDLFRILDEHEVRDTVQIRLQRQGQERTVTVTLGGFVAQ